MGEYAVGAPGAGAVVAALAGPAPVRVALWVGDGAFAAGTPERPFVGDFAPTEISIAEARVATSVRACINSRLAIRQPMYGLDSGWISSQ